MPTLPELDVETVRSVDQVIPANKKVSELHSSVIRPPRRILCAPKPILRILFFACLCGILLAIAIAVPLAITVAQPQRRTASSAVVLTDLGTINGVYGGLTDGTDRFLGIEYASVPLRFGLSVLRDQPWQGVLNATSFGPLCVQSESSLFAGFAGGAGALPAAITFSEDCLSLNIYRPSKLQAGTKLPVLLFIHGGGFTLGGGSLYDGSVMSKERHVVVVTINYRLGYFGFLATEPSGFGGMNGIYDQSIALRWVHAHISAFGGDPSRLTIFGESAGSVSVCILACSPQLSPSLVQRVIMESAPCIGPHAALPSHAGWQRSRELLAERNTNITCLRDRDCTMAASLLPSTGIFHLTIDGFMVPMPTRELIQRGLWHPQVTIGGANTFDSLLPIYHFFHVHGMIPQPSLPTSMTQLPTYLQAAGLCSSDQSCSNVIAHYNPADFSDSVSAAFIQANGDYERLCPMLELLSYLALNNVDKDVYSFVFAHLTDLDLASQAGLTHISGAWVPNWASHEGELPFVFGLSAVPALGNGLRSVHVNFTEQESRLSALIQTYWASTAERNSPNHEGSLAWPAAGNLNATMFFELNPRIVFNYHSSQCLSFQKSWI